MTTRFSDFELHADLLQGIVDVGYESPTPIQAQTIELLLAGRDVIGCAQTGTGKTAAFSLPVLQRIQPGGPNPQALIIAPTRELADQVHKSIQDYSRHLAVKTVVVYGGASSRFQEHQLRGGVDIVVATPGRLLDHVRNRLIRLYDLKFLILDEADRMLDMGFIPDIEEILSYVPRERQTLLFSATMPPAIEKLAQNMTRNPEMVVAGTRGSTASSVTQLVYHVDKNSKLKLLLSLLKGKDLTSVIIFSRTKIGTAKLAQELIQQGIDAAPIHSNLTQIQRERALEGFKQGTFKVLVATDIAARGIDINNVSHVINFDTPTHAEDYVHRIGRTGRASATGEAITFSSPEEKKYLLQIEKLINQRIPVAGMPSAEAPQRASVAEKKAATGRTRSAGRNSVKAVNQTEAPEASVTPAQAEPSTAARTSSRPRRSPRHESAEATLAPVTAPAPSQQPERQRQQSRSRPERAPDRAEAPAPDRRERSERPGRRQESRLSPRSRSSAQTASRSRNSPQPSQQQPAVSHVPSSQGVFPPSAARASTSPRHFFRDQDEIEYLD